MLKLSKGVVTLGLAGVVNLAAAATVVIDGQSIPGSDIQSISISPSTGNIFINTFDGYTVTKDGGSDPDPTGGVTINSMTRTKSSMLEGDTATISWETSNAVSCDTTNGTSGWRSHNPSLPNGSKNVIINNAGTWVFTLVCTGSAAGDVTQRSVTIVVTAESEPPPDPQPNNCPTPPLAGSTTSWQNFWGVAFPNPTYQNEETVIARTGYLAVSFNTGNVVDDGALLTVESTKTQGARKGAISACPGDFDVPPECQQVWGIGGSIRWATNGRSGACQLEPNKTYHFNVSFTDGFDSGSSTCNDSPCVTVVQANNF